jgi:hypothetical protein
MKTVVASSKTTFRLANRVNHKVESEIEAKKARFARCNRCAFVCVPSLLSAGRVSDVTSTFFCFSLPLLSQVEYQQIVKKRVKWTTNRAKELWSGSNVSMEFDLFVQLIKRYWLRTI